MKQITTWADAGIEPDFKPGRWVQLGKPSLLNFWLTGLPGGKIYFQSSWPFARYVPNTVPFSNYKTGFIDEARLEFPKGMKADGWVKGLFRQRKIV